MCRIPDSAFRNGWFCSLLIFCSAAACADWAELKNCRLVENLSNDGDSFVVQPRRPYRGQEQVRFRLYFVDTAETDAHSDFKRDRLREQAAYWEQDDPEFALQMGLRAGQTVKRMLRAGFTVLTKGEYAPTMGAPRFYALVRVDGHFLDELLVEAGLARIYGQGTDLPDGTDEEDHWRTLHRLERAARADRRNGWRRADSSAGQPVESTFEPYDSKTRRAAWIYSLKNGRKVMVLPAGTPVSVMAAAEASRFRVRFKKDGRVYEGLCESGSLDPR